jgi:para-nitrobenzyl esterase
MSRNNLSLSPGLVAPLWLIFVLATFTPAWAQTVATDTGTFTGVNSHSAPESVAVFYGIRYAAPPLGAARWTPPQMPAAPRGKILADSPGPACPQPNNTAPLPQSEDCLFLNVYAPAAAHAQSKLPVFLWIHGGALLEGTGADYDPSTMVEENNIIVVTINYRLGALGWLVEPGLRASSTNSFQNAGDGGDYGLMDQQFAMQWVQRNIGGFGGDAGKVTIGGESAGGLSVSSNLASVETGINLFRGAMVESGAYMLHDLPSEAAYEAKFGAAFDALLGCAQPNDAVCLRAAPVSAILAAQGAAFGSAGISPDFGVKVLPEPLRQAWATGNFIRVPVLQGSNANEGRFFEPAYFPFSSTLGNIVAAGGPANYDLSHPNTFCEAAGSTAPVDCTYPQEINLLLGLVGFPAAANTAIFDAALAAEYPLANFPDPYLPRHAASSDEALSQIFTDLVFACNASDSNLDLSRYVTVFGYQFNDPKAPPTPGAGVVLLPPNDEYGFPTASEHGSELQFLFNFGTSLSAGEQQLAGEMKTYWGNFVNSGDPNLPASVSLWAPFNRGEAVQALVPGPALPHPLPSFRDQHFCRIWEPFLIAEAGR